MAKSIDEITTPAPTGTSSPSAQHDARVIETSHHIVKITDTEVMLRDAFLKAIEGLNWPDYELPAELSDDAKAVLSRTWELLRERGLDASSLVGRQPNRDLVAMHSPSLAAQQLMASTLANAEMKPVGTVDPMQPAIDALEIALRELAIEAKAARENPMGPAIVAYERAGREMARKAFTARADPIPRAIDLMRQAIGLLKEQGRKMAMGELTRQGRHLESVPAPVPHTTAESSTEEAHDSPKPCGDQPKEDAE